MYLETETGISHTFVNINCNELPMNTFWTITKKTRKVFVSHFPNGLNFHPELLLCLTPVYNQVIAREQQWFKVETFREEKFKK